ncbi:MAG: DUF4402 domain-containing protein [Alphaproteobacteria bacterium]|nr:DUF4402 domain-containing protein [Alphaproteobacteria bacterium]NCQ88767.1 DUF4402 domain-containing protein [Alphaproteobacteria bacterium]NCT07310.1 DUF4402 domain-containing protein [Alphaproteobacteria bacterium]
MKSLFSGKKYIGAAFILFLGLGSLSVTKHSHAQTITENIPLSFGRFVLVDNNAVRRLRIRTNCTENADPEYMFIIDPQCGNYTVTGYPPFTPLTVTLANGALNGPGANIFRLRALATVPTTITTDATGEATFEVRGRLDSSGNGGGYIDGGYTGSFTMTVTD